MRHVILQVISKLWRASAPLTASGLVMAVLAVVFTAGLVLDPRTILGAPAWVKPLKFAVSIAIYSLTLAWIFTYLPNWPRTRRIVGIATMLAMFIEIAIIGGQAWRGTTSHFNLATPFDEILWRTMGATIVLQTIISVTVAIALWRERFADAAMGWALRLGMVITIAGASLGGLMVPPTPAQRQQAALTGRMTVAGAHTVGAPDGGPGLPVTGWSTEAGDLRIAHFLGLHALQALPLLALATRRTREEARTPLVVSGAASYAALVGIIVWQALRAQPLIAPDALTLGVFGLWAALTIVVPCVVTSRRSRVVTQATV